MAPATLVPCKLILAVILYIYLSHQISGWQLTSNLISLMGQEQSLMLIVQCFTYCDDRGDNFQDMSAKTKSAIICFLTV